MYKSKLNQLCQKNGWRTPTYSCTNDGLLNHTPLFKASVFVNGATFDSQSLFKFSKSAHNDVAALALSHFTTSPSPSRELNKKSDELSLPVLPEEKKNVTTTSPPTSHTALSIKEPNLKKCKEICYLLCNRVRVHKFIPITVLPKGDVVMPVGRDKWTAVNLEFV